MMDDAAPDEDLLHPAAHAGDGEDGAMPERGAAWQRRLAEARKAREEVLAARVAEGRDAQPLIARRPFDADGRVLPVLADRPRTSPAQDPLMLRPKPWEAGAPGRDPAPDPDAPLHRPSAPREAKEGPSARGAVPAAATGSVAPAGSARALRQGAVWARLPERLTSAGGIAAAVVLGLLMGLAGGLALDRYAAPNVAAAGTAGEAAATGGAREAEAGPVTVSAPAPAPGTAAGGRPGGAPAPVAPSDAPQPRTPPAPQDPGSSAAPPEGPSLPGAELRPGPAPAGAPAPELAAPAGPDPVAVVATRTSELSPRLFFGDGDRTAAEPVPPEAERVVEALPSLAAAFVPPAVPSPVGPFDAADAAPWPVMRPAPAPGATAAPGGPSGDLSLAGPGGDRPAASTSPARADEPGRAAFAEAAPVETSPYVELRAAPQPVLLQPVRGQAPGFETDADAPVPGPARPVLASAPRGIVAPSAGPAPSLLASVPPPAADISASPAADPAAGIPAPGGRSDIRLVGGSAEDRRRLASQDIAFTATVEALFPAARREVRYFHPADAALAGSLARELGADLRDFSSFRPVPPEGRIEVRLPTD